MDYSSLTEQQIQKRYYSLPDSVRDVLESEKKMEMIGEICRSHHLVDEEKTLIVEQLTGLILLGFVSADDLSREISENVHLNRQHSGDIASEISRRLFEPFKSELEKIYSPAAEAEKSEEAKEVLDLRETETREADRPDLSWEVVDLKKEDTPKIIETEKKVLASAASAGEEIIDLKKMENAAEIPSAESKTVEIKPLDVAQGRPAVMDEIEPLIIHKETEIKSVSGFDKKRSLGDLFGFLKKRPVGEIRTEKPPIVQIEIGQTEKLEAETRGKENVETETRGQQEPPKIRVVHYGGLRTPISPFGKEAEEAVVGEKPETSEKTEIPAPVEQKIESQETSAAKTEILAPSEQKAARSDSSVEPAKKPEEEKPENKKPESDEEIIDLRKI